MRVLDMFANGFINFFGITQPSEETRRRASWFIVALLATCFVLVALVGGMFVHVLRGNGN
jgi:hypothetical protein